jgi:hypothetical protein
VLNEPTEFEREPLSWTLAAILETAKLLNTHDIGLIKRPAASSSSGGA